MNFPGIFILLFLCGEIKAQICEVNGTQCIFRSVTLNENQVLSNVSPNPEINEVQFENSSLYSLPSEVFGFFVNLEKLVLKKQKIKTINKNLCENARNFKHLNLNCNEINALKANGFMGCDNLEVLHIGANQLDSIEEEGVFNGLGNLLKLGLDSNNIVTIRENLFEPLVNLKVILLYNNDIEHINENIFKFNVKLEQIALTDNRINSLSPKTFAKLSNLNRLWLSRNKCVNRDWWTNAYQSMEKIKEVLTNCSLNYDEFINRQSLTSR